MMNGLDWMINDYNEWMSECVNDAWMGEWANKRINGWMNECWGEWVSGHSPVTLECALHQTPWMMSRGLASSSILTWSYLPEAWGMREDRRENLRILLPSLDGVWTESPIWWSWWLFYAIRDHPTFLLAGYWPVPTIYVVACLPRAGFSWSMLAGGADFPMSALCSPNSPDQKITAYPVGS